MQLNREPLQNVHLWQYLVMKLSFIFQFQLTFFAFSLILGDPLMSFLP